MHVRIFNVLYFHSFNFYYYYFFYSSKNVFLYMFLLLCITMIMYMYLNAKYRSKVTELLFPVYRHTDKN